ncbi:MAG TPA: hypothetical protein VEU28_05365 [Actinomycetota bacterium]|nr:hypothetical protein [Actinomycetota bacterium]
MLGLVLMLAACGDAEDPSPGQTSQSPTASPVAAVTIDWAARPPAPVELGDGFTVQACPGDAPFLCVSRESEAAGFIEYFPFPAPEGDAQDALRELVDDDYRTFTEDRETTCPSGYEVETVEPAAAEVGGEEGLRSEYFVTDAGGKTVERYVKHWAIAEGQVHLVSAEAQEEGSCSPGDGGQFTDAALTDFEPFLAAIAEGSRFPAPATPAAQG